MGAGVVAEGLGEGDGLGVLRWALRLETTARASPSELRVIGEDSRSRATDGSCETGMFVRS